MSLIKARRMVVTVSHLMCLPRLICSEPFSNRTTWFALPKIARRWWSQTVFQMVRAQGAFSWGLWETINICLFLYQHFEKAHLKRFYRTHKIFYLIFGKSCSLYVYIFHLMIGNILINYYEYKRSWEVCKYSFWGALAIAIIINWITLLTKFIVSRFKKKVTLA